MARDDYASTVSGIADVINALSELAKPTQEELLRLQMDFTSHQSALDRESRLLDKKITRNEKRYDIAFNEFQTVKKDYEATTGQIYKLPDEQRKDDVIDVLNDITEPTVNSLTSLLTDLKTDTQNLQTATGTIKRQISKSKIISDFYKGFGHDFSKGDPERWDVKDFSKEALTEYMALYPELKGANQEAFYEGVISREEAGLFQNIQALNTIIDETKASQLKSSIKELEYNTLIENVDEKQLKVTMANIDFGVHNMISKKAVELNTGILSPAISATNLYAGTQESGSASDISTAKELQEEELLKVGTLISGIEAQDERMIEDNLRLGSAFLSGNINYVNSIPGYLKGSGELNYAGWVDALQEIEMFHEHYKSQFEAGAINNEQLSAYKNNIEQLIGGDLDSFSRDLGILIAASESSENKAQLLVLKSMQQTIAPTQLPIVDPTDDPADITTPVVIDSADPALKSLQDIKRSSVYKVSGDYATIKAGIKADIEEKSLSEKALEEIERLSMTSAGLDELTEIERSSMEFSSMQKPVIRSLNKISNKQLLLELTGKLHILKKAGFQGTEEYENISNNIKVLNREINAVQRYEDYISEMKIKLSEEKMSDEDITEISNLTGVNKLSLIDYLKKGNTKKVLDIISNIPGTPRIKKRAAYERELQK